MVIANKAHLKWVAIGLAIMLTLGARLALATEIQYLSARQAKVLIDDNSNRSNSEFVILDVRTPKEFTQGHIAGAVLLDFRNPKFVSGLKRLDRSKTYLIYCRSGNRSGQTLKLIESMDFRKVYHLKHGIIDWQKEKLPLAKP
jgi:rhodanese-related sulfurtransferase